MNSHHDLADVRCRRCRALLFRGRADLIEIKCRKCGSLQIFGHEVDRRVIERSETRAIR